MTGMGKRAKVKRCTVVRSDICPFLWPILTRATAESI